MTPNDKAEMAPFSDKLKQILTKAQMHHEIMIGQIILILSGKGYAAMLTLFSLPFCLPIQIPGFSTPFGFILAFIGLRIAFGKHPWWPKMIREKKLASAHIEKVLSKAISILESMQKYLYPRMTFLTKNSLLHRMHGILIVILSLLLSLPLPIPFSNMLAAMPILAMGLGLLEDDGVMIIAAYVLAFICFTAFIGLFYLGKFELTQIFNSL